MSSASAAAAGNTPAAMMMMMPRTQPLGPPAAPLLVPLPAGGGAAAPLALAEPAMLRVDAAADRLAEAGRLGERVSKPALLAPVMGMLLGLWEAHCAGAAGAAGAPVHQDDLLQELAQLADPQMMAALAFMQVQYMLDIQQAQQCPCATNSHTLVCYTGDWVGLCLPRVLPASHVYVCILHTYRYCYCLLS